MTEQSPPNATGTRHRLGAMEFELLSELKRRNVFRVAGAYLGTSWFLVHMGTVLGESFGTLHRLMPGVIAALGAALPVVLIAAWLFELTPQGFKLTRRVDRRNSIRELTARKLDVIIVGLFTLAVAAMLADRWILHRAADESVVPVFTLVILVLLADRVVGRSARATTAQVPASGAATISGSGPQSIAVLPFIDLSEKKDQEYFSDGLSEELISVLTKVSDLRVPARTSCFYFKGRPATVPEIAKALNVAHLLEGSVRKAGDRIRVAVQLIRADSGFHLWAETYDRKLDDIFEVQKQIAAAVVLALKAALLSVAGGPPTSQKSSEAYQLYLQGRFHWYKRSPEDFRRAIEFFGRAIIVDPNYCLAFTGLADCYSLLPIYDNNVTAAETMPLAKEAALKALSLDNTVAEAHASYALTLNLLDYDWEGAERHYQRAIELSPNSPTPHQWYGEMLVNTGRFDEGLAQARRALQLDPLSLIANMALGIALNSARRYDEAIVQLHRTLELDSEFADASYFLFEAYANKGMYADAVEVYAKQNKLDGEPSAEITAMKDSFAKGSWEAFLQHRISFLEAQTQPVPEEIAALCARAGDRDKAFAWLEKSYEWRGARLTHLKVDARYDNLRADARYAQLLRRIGLT